MQHQTTSQQTTTGSSAQQGAEGVPHSPFHTQEREYLLDAISRRAIVRAWWRKHWTNPDLPQAVVDGCVREGVRQGSNAADALYSLGGLAAAW